MGRTSLATLFLAAWALAAGGGALAAPDGVERYELDNGLKVRLRPIAGAKDVAVLVLYDVGEAHDPEGQSGLGHLVEHCYVTSAAGETPARTAEAMMAAYPSAWNAQTGSDYTVFAFIAPRARLEAELADAAARMGALRITQADLDREKPRMAAELATMYGRIPTLAASNRLRARVRPPAPGARKGGVEAQIEALTLKDVAGHHRAYYKPRHARLVLAGAFDGEEARSLIEKHFGALPRGEALPTPRAPGPSSLDATLDLNLGEAPESLARIVCLARRAPTPADATYPPFLLLAARLFRGQMAARGEGRQLIYPILDAPEVLFLQAPVPEGVEARATLDALQGALDAAAEPALTPAGRFYARQFFGHSLSTFPLPDRALAGNVYGVAFGIGRREQMGIDGGALGRRLGEVTDAELKSAAAALLPRTNGANIVVHAGPGSPAGR